MKKTVLSRSIFLVGAGFISLAIATIWLRLHIVKTSYEIGLTTQKIKALEFEREGLELRTARLRSPRKLQPLAKQKYKLNPPSADQIIYIHAAPTAADPHLNLLKGAAEK